MGGNFQVFSLDGPDAQLREHKKRRPHKKTKAGCFSCKVKRVKCDQARPICLRCQRNGLPCSYNPLSPTSHCSSSSTSSQAATDWSIPKSLQLDAFTTSHPSQGTSPQALLHHFEQNWGGIFVLPNLSVTSTPLVETAQGRPYLLNTLLAISASHLRHHTPNPTSHRLAEHFQQAVALRSFNELLCKPLASHPPSEIGILLLVAILFNLLTFALPADEDPSPAAAATADLDPSRSWVFSTRPDRLDWLAVQLGLRGLVIASLPFRHGGRIILDESSQPLTDAEFRDSVIAPDGPELGDDVPDAWLKVFGIGRKPSKSYRRRCLLEPERKKKNGRAAGDLEKKIEGQHKCRQMLEDEEMREHLFREPLFLLAQTRNIPPTLEHVFHYMQLLGKLEPEFRIALYDRDERALWVFGYWLGLMCRLEYIWWVSRRARRDFRAIVIWLRSCGVTERPGKEGLLWTELMKDLEDSVHWVPSLGVLRPAMPQEQREVTWERFMNAVDRRLARRPRHSRFP